MVVLKHSKNLQVIKIVKKRSGKHYVYCWSKDRHGSYLRTFKASNYHDACEIYTEYWQKINKRYKIDTSGSEPIGPWNRYPCEVEKILGKVTKKKAKAAGSKTGKKKAKAAGSKTGKKKATAEKNISDKIRKTIKKKTTVGKISSKECREATEEQRQKAIERLNSWM